MKWPAVVEALKDVGYNDYVIAEIAPPYQFHPERLIYEIADAMTAIGF